MATQDYAVDLTRSADGNNIHAHVREFSLSLGSKARDMSVGFNPVETLLSAAGACITSSLGLVAKNSNVALDELNITAVGTRQDDPPRLTAARLELEIASPASDEKIDKIVRIAGNASTVVSTLREALELNISWRRPEAER